MPVRLKSSSGSPRYPALHLCAFSVSSITFMPFLSSPRSRLSGLPFAGLVLLVSLGAALDARSFTLPNDGFDPNANGIVNTLLIQPDGKLLMGGYFTQIHPYGNPISGHSYIARLNHDGTVDSGFSPNANDVVRVMALQPNGQIIVGGQFTTIQPGGGGAPVPRGYVARLNADGSLDNVFNPNANGVVYAVAYQPNGQIVIGGSFTTVQPGGAAAPTTRNHIARFNSDGTLDTGFDPNADRPVLSLAIDPSGKVLVGGGFTTLQPNGASSTTARSCAARLNSDGSLDTGFDPEPNGAVNSILVLPSGKIIFGGQFTTFYPNGTTTYIQCDFLARINADGTLDTSYIINPLAAVSAVALQPDGRLVIGGTFTQIFPANNLSATAAPYVARINPDGSVDGGFIPNPNQAVSAIAVQPDGNVVLGGYFTALQPPDSATSVARNHIARVTTYGIPDATLSPDTGGTVFASAVLPNGQILVAGSFLSIGGVTQGNLARINADGSLDPAFAPTLNGPVMALAVQPDGKILIGGQFTLVDGFSRGYVARLNPDGTLDGPFNPNANSSVLAIAVQSDGKILLGGQFSGMAPNGSTGTYGTSEIARVNADGSLDITFNPVPSASVYSLNVMSDGRILVGGAFTSIAGAARGYVARLLPSGKIDPAEFDPEPNAPVYAIAVQPDGKVLLGGSFTGVLPQTGKGGGTPTYYTDAGGHTVTVPQAGYNATTGIFANRLVRLNTDGTMDFTFLPDASSDVLGIAIQPDGSIIVAGILTSFAQNGATTGVTRNYIGRVSATGALDPAFNPNANGLVETVGVLANGRILIGGAFTTLQPNGSPSITYSDHLAILNPDGTVDPSFTVGSSANPGGQINTIAQMLNDQFIAGGTFGPISGNQSSHLARFNPDGTPDNTYYANIDGPVNAISVLPSGATTLTATSSGAWLESSGLVRHVFTEIGNGEVVAVAQQPDGKVIVAGQFTGYAGSSTANLIRLNPDGTLDTSFTATTSGLVNTIILQPDNKILVGGNFAQINGVANSYLARLNPDGTLDTAFAPQPSLQVIGLALQSDGKIIACGDFTFMHFNTSTSVAVNYVARLNPDGTLDTSFKPDPNGPIYTAAVLKSGKILIGGSFPTLTPFLGSTTNYIQNLARLNPDGSVDLTYYPDPNGAIVSLAVQPDGKVLAAGSFTSFQANPNLTGTQPGASGYVTPPAAVTRNFIARLNDDGSVDSGFNPNVNGTLTSVSLQANGQVYFGGNFNSVQPNNAGYPVSRSNVARVNSDGTLDSSFDPSVNGTVNTVQPLADGSVFVGGSFSSVQVGGAVLVGGSFSHVAGNPDSNLVLLNSDGTFNASYGANPDGPVNAIAIQADGKSLVGGGFSHVAGQARSNLARLGEDGSLDASFAADTNAPVNAVEVQPDGTIFVGGAFTRVGSQGVSYLARLGASGSPDPSFTPSINGAVDSLVRQPNGQVVIAGAFTSVAGHPVGGLARLNSDGTLDSSFNPNANGAVQAISQLVDGTFYVGGAFTSIGGQAISHAAHILSDGTVDPSFNPNPNDIVNAVSVQVDGKLVIGGKFTKAGGLDRFLFARFAAPTPVSQSLSVSPDHSTVTWTRTGSAPALGSVTFSESTDGTHWTSIGQASTSDGISWQISGIPPAGASLFEVRATGVSLSSQYSSAGLVQAIYLVDALASPSIDSPSSVTATSGAAFAFTVTATDSPTFFSATGLPPGLGINSATGLISGTPTTTGTYHVAIKVANAGGGTSSTLTITVAAAGSGGTPSNSASRLINLSSRADLSGNNVLIAGFVISGSSPKTVLIRAVGPGLDSFGVNGTMVSPELQLYSASGTLLSQNTGWGGGSSLSAVFAQVGAFALLPSSLDAALVSTLAPGAYTVQVFDPTAAGGIVLAEIYDTTGAPLPTSSRMANISARGTVSSGAGALIGGFVISGSTNKAVLIRGVGPGLAGFGVTGFIPDPVLKVYDQNGNVVAENTAWASQTAASPYQYAVPASGITSADSSVGAFALTSAADTAVIVDLPPGSYTFEVTSASNATGGALGEVYELP